MRRVLIASAILGSLLAATGCAPAIIFFEKPANVRGRLERPGEVTVRYWEKDAVPEDGVKLGDEVLVTAEGVEVLAPYPFDVALSSG